MTPLRNATPHRFAIESLESRTFLSVTVIGSLSNSNGTPGSTSTAVDLGAVFDDPTVPTVVRMTTPLGNLDIQLLDTQKPLTVQNFLRYVRSGAYDTTFFHRSTSVLTGAQLIQGGGYASSTFTHIPTNAPVINEFATNFVVSNSRGTIAMAKTGSADAATSEFLINVGNNVPLDDPSNLGGFTVFGNVTADTLATVDTIAAVPRFVAADPFGEIPLRNYTVDDLNAGKVPAAADNLITTTVDTLPKLTFTAASSNPAIVSPTIDGNSLSLTYGQVAGDATITVTASDSTGHSSVATFNAENALAVKLGVGGAKALAFMDADGMIAQVSLKGAGSGSVTFTGTGVTSTPGKGGIIVQGTNVGLASIAITGTSGTSAVTINTKGGNGSVSVGSITADNSLKSISAKTTAITSSLTTGGAIGKLDLGSASNAQIHIGGTGADKPLAITVGSLVDTSLTSGVPIKSLKVNDIGDTDGVQAALSTPSIGTMTVAGNLSGEAMTFSQPFGGKSQGIKSLKVTGGITNTSIKSVASIGSITASTLNASTFFAGVASTGLPAAGSDFANGASIGSVKIAGTFVNSNIAASVLGKLTIGSLQTSNGGTAFGFAADTIAGLSTSVNGARLSFKKLTTQADVVAQLKGVDLVDGRVIVV